MKNFYFFITLFFYAASSFAQNGWTVYNSSNSSLANTTYLAIAIDQTGNIWSGGSYSGVYKFNGSTWTGYDSYNSNLADDDINALIIDNNNKLWVGNYGGLSVFNGTSFTNYDTINAGFKGHTVNALGKDKNGKLWLSSVNGSFGYQGITTYDGTTWTNLSGMPSQMVGREIYGFAFTSSNVAWIATDNGMSKYSGAFSYWPYASTGLWSSEAIAVDADGNVWAGGFDGLLKYDGSWSFLSSTTDLGFSSNTFYYSIYPDGNFLWIGSSAGFLKFNRLTGTVVANFKSGNSPLTTNCVTGIAKDSNGNLWLATSVGVVKMDPAVVAVVEPGNSINYNIYPNPSSSVFHFTFDKPVGLSYTVCAADGKQVASGKIDSKTFDLDLSDKSKGIYLMHVTDQNNSTAIVKLSVE